MKRIVLLAVITFILMFAVMSVVNAQNVTGSVGLSASQSAIVGVEFTTKTVGMYVNRYFIDKDITNFPKISPQSPNYYVSVEEEYYYDGVMFGFNWHVPGNIILLSAGIGSLNEYKIRRVWTQTLDYYAEYDQVFAFEFMAGKDFKLNNNVCVGIKGGVNTKASVIGIVSLGYYFK